MRKILTSVCPASLVCLGLLPTIALSLQPALASAPTGPIGRWFTGNGGGVVEIDR